jgi:hypothetical protein
VVSFGFVEIEDSADVWMIERGGKPRFAFEALEVCFSGGQLRRQDFDHNGAAKFSVSRFVHGALPANAELFENLVMAENLSNHGKCDGYYSRIAAWKLPGNLTASIAHTAACGQLNTVCFLRAVSEPGAVATGCAGKVRSVKRSSSFITNPVATAPGSDLSDGTLSRSMAFRGQTCWGQSDKKVPEGRIASPPGLLPLMRRPSKFNSQAEAAAVLIRNEECPDHLRAPKVSAKLVEFRQPKIVAIEVGVGRVARVAL